MEQQVFSAPEKQVGEALSAVRRMLVIVSFFALAVVVVVVWQYFTLGKLRKDIDSQQQQLQSARQKVAVYCDGLAIREFQLEHKPDVAAKQLDQCMSDFPQEETLPAYKARIYATAFARDHSREIDLQYALQAAELSNKLKPNEDAYEWQGLANCLKAAYGPAADQKAACTSAVNAFHQDFLLAPSRKSSITRMQEFNDYCSAAIQKAALYPNSAGGC